MVVADDSGALVTVTSPLSPQHQQQQESLGELANVFEDPIWAEVYAAMCCDSREVPSIESARGFRDALLVQNPETKQDRLLLRSLRMGATTVSCLALQLKDRAYTRLDLSENQLGDHSMLSVRSLVRALPKLRQLLLAGNFVSAEGAQELAEELETNSTLEVLVLGSLVESGSLGRGFRPNALGAEGLYALLDALHRNPHHTLTTLNLCQTSLGAEAGRHLAQFLEHDRVLLHLDISCNPLSSEGICALLPHCTRLRALEIADTGCRGELIHSHLSGLLQHTSTLTRLSVAHNPLETRPLRRISRGIANCKSLVSLCLESTAMGTEGVTVLVEAMLGSVVPTLTELDVSANQLGQLEAATALAHLIAKYPTLQILRLGQNAIGDSGMQELARAIDPEICAGCTVQHLELNSCRVGTVGAEHLLHALARNETVRALRLEDNFLDDSLDMTLIDKLTYIHDLQLSSNRLSHAALQRVAQVCARNRQRTRDEEPAALRTEMHRLLFQETKLGQARQQLEQDTSEIAKRKACTEQAQRELQALRASEADQRRQMSGKIDFEESELLQRRNILAHTSTKLEDAAKRYAEQQQELRERLRERERVLMEMQVQSEHDDRRFEQRQREHPEEVERIKARMQEALDERDRSQEQAKTMKQRLRKQQNKALIDFKP